MELLVLFAALTLPALSSALFFGVTLTNTAGATILALNPTAVAGLAAIGAAGAGLAVVAGGLLAPKPAPAPTPTNGRYKKHRGRRDQPTEAVNIADQLYDKIFGDLAENKMVGCFQRLVCDIAARPAGFADNVPILEGLAVAKQLELSPTARTVSEQLLKAMQFGADLEDVGHCEGFFSECQWTGEQMDLVIKDMKNRV